MAEIRAGGTVEEMEREAEENAKKGPPKTMRTAMTNIIVADATMSLDNVLAVAGGPRSPGDADLWFGIIDRFDGIDGKLHRETA